MKMQVSRTRSVEAVWNDVEGRNARISIDTAASAWADRNSCIAAFSLFSCVERIAKGNDIHLVQERDLNCVTNSCPKSWPGSWSSPQSRTRPHRRVLDSRIITCEETHLPAVANRRRPLHRGRQVGFVFIEDFYYGLKCFSRII